MVSLSLQSADKQRLHDLVEEMADQLCPAVDGKFDFLVKVSAHNEAIDKLQMLVNLVLDSARRSLAATTAAKEESDIANKAKSEFLANISHEVRTPLNGIMGFAEVILESDSMDRVHEQAKIILDESRHLLALINSVLDHAKIEAGKLELEQRPVDLTRLLQSIVSVVHRQTEEKGLRFHASLGDSVPPWVMGDPLRLRQILMNLIGNAIKFTGQGSVTVRIEAVDTHTDQPRLGCSVTDTGVGIPPEKQKTIFGSFIQADGSTTRTYGGTGLGTTIAKTLVELMGGQIGLVSEPGKGSTFWFVIPLQVCDPAAEANKAAPTTEGPPHGALGKNRVTGRILLAEDYPTNQKVVRLHLEGAGHSLDIVENGKQAVAACAEHAYDLILMDIQMPQMNGYAATRRIRAANSPCADIPIIGLTANADSETRTNCLKAGMNDVIRKPFRRDRLLWAVDHWLSAFSSDSHAGGSGQLSRDGDGIDSAKSVPLEYTDALEVFGALETIQKLARDFLKHAEQQIGVMQDALARHDLETLGRESHKIKSGAGSLEARPLAAVAEQIEQLSKSGEADNIPDLLQKFVVEFEHLKEYVQRHDQPEMQRGQL